MARESIYTLMRPGFPKETLDENSYRNTIEYIGKYADIQAANCQVGITWGDYQGQVTSATAEPIEGTDYAILNVVVERKHDKGDYPGGGGEKVQSNEELDWVDVQRDLYQHPAFVVGGGGAYELTNEDVAAIKKWEQMPKPEYKKDYIYVTGKLSEWTGGSEGTATLSANAKMFARGLEMGIDHWVDKAPVARLSEIYLGGPPPDGSAGQKETPTVDYLPSGYEWVRSSDRGVRRGGQARWQRSIEWIGAKKVWIDRDEIFWTAP